MSSPIRARIRATPITFSVVVHFSLVVLAIASSPQRTAGEESNRLLSAGSDDDMRLNNSMCEVEFSTLNISYPWNHYTYGCRTKLNGECLSSEGWCNVSAGDMWVPGYGGGHHWCGGQLGIPCGCCVPAVYATLMPTVQETPGPSLSHSPSPLPSSSRPTPVPTRGQLPFQLHSDGALYGAYPPELFGHNQINGPGYQLPYSSEGLIAAAEATWEGILRFPGGTVANYWYMPNATIIKDCSLLETSDDDVSTDDASNLRLNNSMCEVEFSTLNISYPWNHYTYGCRTKLDGECLSSEGWCNVSAGDMWVPGYGGGHHWCGGQLGIPCGCCVPAAFATKPPTPSPTTHADDDGGGIHSGDDGDIYVYDYCRQKGKVDKDPPQTYSVSNFANGLGGASPTRSARGSIYVLNVLTVPLQGIIDQLDFLKSLEATEAVPVHFLEFGNELFMAGYDWRFPDGETYMDEMTPALEHARTLFPNATLSVPAGYRFCGGDTNQFSDWNEGIAPYSHLFDAVTIHEYTACTKSVDVEGAYASLNEKRSALLLWGEWALDTHLKWVERFFPRNVSIQVTEYGYAKWAGDPLNGDPFFDLRDDDDAFATLLNSGLTGIFKAQLILSGVHHSLRAWNPHLVLNSQIFNTQAGSEKDDLVGAVDVAADGGFVGTGVNGVGQILSHLAYIALNISDTAVALNTRLVDECPTITFQLNASEEIPAHPTGTFSCIHATTFAHTCRPPGALPIYTLINRCNESSRVELNISVATAAAAAENGDGFEAGQTFMRTVAYEALSYGPYTELSKVVGGNGGIPYAHPWPENGPLNTTRTVRAVDVGRGSVTVTLQGWSLTIIDWDQPQLLSPGCPKQFAAPRTESPTLHPTLVPRPKPSSQPLPIPSSRPSPLPTLEPIPAPSLLPSTIPSSTPTPMPSQAPFPLPSLLPTTVPSSAPTPMPSQAPAPLPSLLPTTIPSNTPTSVPLPQPSQAPVPVPSCAPTTTPVPSPGTPFPSLLPSSSPTSKPSTLPTPKPSPVPSPIPSAIPTPMPSFLPSPAPSPSPSSPPFPLPTEPPTQAPVLPTGLPTVVPTPIDEVAAVVSLTMTADVPADLAAAVVVPSLAATLSVLETNIREYTFVFSPSRRLGVAEENGAFGTGTAVREEIQEGGNEIKMPFPDTAKLPGLSGAVAARHHRSLGSGYVVTFEVRQSAHLGGYADASAFNMAIASKMQLAVDNGTLAALITAANPNTTVAVPLLQTVTVVPVARPSHLPTAGPALSPPEPSPSPSSPGPPGPSSDPTIKSRGSGSDASAASSSVLIVATVVGLIAVAILIFGGVVCFRRQSSHHLKFAKESGMDESAFFEMTARPSSLFDGDDVVTVGNPLPKRRDTIHLHTGTEV